MNDKYFRNRIERSPLGKMGLDLLDAQQKLILQEYEIESLRIKWAMYKAYFFHNSELAEKLEKQEEENKDALTGENEKKRIGWNNTMKRWFIATWNSLVNSKNFHVE